jgi:hypothetical protein
MALQRSVLSVAGKITGLQPQYNNQNTAITTGRQSLSPDIHRLVIRGYNLAAAPQSAVSVATKTENAA